MQQQIISMPGQALLKPENVYQTLDDFCKFSGLLGANNYFIDPGSDIGKQFTQEVQQAASQKVDPDVIQQQAMAQIAQAEVAKAQSSIQVQVVP